MEPFATAVSPKQELEEAIHKGHDTLDGTATVEQACHVHRVPEEILGEIFMFALTLMDYCSRDWESNENKVIALCLVCKQWRRVVIRTPALWASLEINDDFNEVVYKKAERWLERAKSLPKTLELRMPDECCALECCLNNQDLTRFLTQGPMLNRLLISCKNWHCITQLLSLLAEANQRRGKMANVRPWDAVRELELSLVDDWCRGSAKSADVMAQIYNQFPPITSFDLSFEYCSLGPQEILAPVHIPESFLVRLTKFSFDYGDVANVSSILPVLKACQNVEDLSLCFGKPRFDATANPLRQTPSKDNAGFLPRMRRLQLWSSDTMQCLESFNSPLLEELDLTFGGGWSSDGAKKIGELAIGQYVPDFIDRSQCHKTMRRLKLYGMLVSATAMERLLHRLPCLVHLVMESVEVEPMLYQSLGSCRPLAMPALRILKLVDVPKEYDVDKIRDYLDARREFVKDDGTRLVDTQLSIQFQPIVLAGVDF